MLRAVCAQTHKGACARLHAPHPVPKPNAHRSSSPAAARRHRRPQGARRPRPTRHRRTSAFRSARIARAPCVAWCAHPCGERRTRRARRPGVMVAGRERAPSKERSIVPSSARGAFYHAFFGEWGAFRSGLPCGERRTRRARRPAVMAAGRERAVPSKVLFYPFEATRSVLSCLFRQGERSIMPFLASGGLRSGLPCVCAEGRAPPCRRLHVGVHCGRPCGCVCVRCVPSVCQPTPDAGRWCPGAWAWPRIDFASAGLPQIFEGRAGPKWLTQARHTCGAGAERAQSASVPFWATKRPGLKHLPDLDECNH